jgi:hypothetical protein
MRSGGAEQGLRDPDSAPNGRLRGAGAALRVGRKTSGAVGTQWRERVTAGGRRAAWLLELGVELELELELEL